MRLHSLPPCRPMRRNRAVRAPFYDPASTIPNPNGTGYVRSAFPGNQVPLGPVDPVARSCWRCIRSQILPAKTTSSPIRASRWTTTSSSAAWTTKLQRRIRSSDAFPPRQYQPSSGHLAAARPVRPEHRHSGSALVRGKRDAYLRAYAAQRGPHRLPGNPGNAEHQWPALVRPVRNYGSARHSQRLGSSDIRSFRIGNAWNHRAGNLLTPATGSGNLPIDKQGRTIQVDDNVSWVRGRHTIKFGFDFQQVTLYANSTLNARPAYTFSGVYTQDPQNRSKTGSPFADFCWDRPARRPYLRDRIARAGSIFIKGMCRMTGS